MERLSSHYSPRTNVTPATGSVCVPYSQPIAPRSPLPEGFDGVDAVEVRARFEEHPEFVAVLADAWDRIKSEFGVDARVRLDVVPEYSGEHTLYATIMGHGSDEDLIARLDRFNESWWFDRVRYLNGSLAFSVGRA